MAERTGNPFDPADERTNRSIRAVSPGPGAGAASSLRDSRLRTTSRPRARADQPFERPLGDCLLGIAQCLRITRVVPEHRLGAVGQRRGAPRCRAGGRLSRSRGRVRDSPRAGPGRTVRAAAPRGRPGRRGPADRRAPFRTSARPSRPVLDHLPELLLARRGHLDQPPVEQVFQRCEAPDLNGVAPVHGEDDGVPRPRAGQLGEVRREGPDLTVGSTQPEAFGEPTATLAKVRENDPRADAPGSSLSCTPLAKICSNWLTVSTTGGPPNSLTRRAR